MEATVAAVVASVPGPGLLAGGPGGIELLGILAAGAVPPVFGITDLLGDDDEDDGGEDDDGVFDDEGGGDLDGLGDLDDGGLEGFDDDDGLAGDDLGGDGSVSELENRLDELENEVASLSSSVNTVENENEAISETVDEIEENVRDLLEIYEMVTRGVNPFVDDTAAGAMGGDAGGTFGLFDDEGGGESGDVDESIADADAEEFFDDDFEEPDDDLADPDDAVVTEGDDGIGEMDDGLDDDLGGTGGDGDDGDDDGKSFEELKEEYESGEAGWDVDDPLEEGDGEGTGDAESEEDTPADDPAEGELALDEGESGEEAPVDGLAFEEGEPVEDGDATGQADAEDAGDAEGPGEPEAEDDAEEEFEFVGEREDDESDGAGRLHLREFPDGYVADLTALEWLEYLIDVGGKSGARDALGYYVDVGWIGPSVEDELQAFLDGIRVSGADGGRPDPGGLAAFDPEHHRRSLAYVARLAGDGDRAAVLDRIEGAGGVDPLDAPAAPAPSPVADGGGSGDLEGGDGDGV